MNLRDIFDRVCNELDNEDDNIFGVSKKIQELEALEKSKKEKEELIYNKFPRYFEKASSTQCMPHVVCWHYFDGINYLCGKCWTQVPRIEKQLAVANTRQRRKRHRKPRWQRR